MRIGITMGDPSGIGPEIIAKSLRCLKSKSQLIVIGDRWVFEKSHKVTKSQGHKVEFLDLNNVNRKNFAFGKIKAEYGKASIEYLDEALKLIKVKRIDCLVTAPVSKEAVNLSGIKFNGHTGYLKKRVNVDFVVMMLLNKKLKFSLLTTHVPLSKVHCLVKREELYKNVLLTCSSLKELFSIPDPRIALCGLNPHASDNGTIGSEENAVIKPAVARLKKIIRHMDGPLGCDIAVKKAYEGSYDCLVAMYHDQALIPLKLTGPDSGVNLTLGLGFIRTSPLHGTAFDIAGKSLADHRSMAEAIKLAEKCSLNQKSG